MLSVRIFVSIGVFLFDFLEIARYACEKSNENPLNIKQKSRPNTNARFGLKVKI